MQGHVCFYCEQSKAPDSLDVDHVIPWCYLLEDRVWNLTLACRHCNSVKSSQTPGDRFLIKLIDRNRKLLAEITKVQASARIAFVARDLREFVTKDIEEHIRTLTTNCRGDGFGTWMPIGF